MLDKQRIITAAHIFKGAGYPGYCFLHRIGNKSEKFKAKLLRENVTADIAELEFLDKPADSFNYLKRSENKHINPGYEVAVVGFPEYFDSQAHVSIKVAKVTNTFTKSTFDHVAIDIDIHGGNSGGPVIDGYLNVVGVAVMGLNVVDTSISGTNAFVSIKHIDQI
jgi:S1-C subfamily serine protease